MISASSSLLEIGASAAELADISSSQEDFGIGYAKVNSSVFGLELSGSGVSVHHIQHLYQAQ